jgi:hypothetical protein
MIIPLHHRKVGPAQPRRSWPTRTRSTQRRQAPFDQELGRLMGSAIIGAHHFKLVFGGVVLLLVFDLVDQQITGIILTSLITICLAWGKLTMQHWEQTRERRARLHERAVRQDRPFLDRECLGQAADLQRLNLQVGECETIAALERQATERAAAIARSAALVQLSGAATHTTTSSDRTFQLSIGEEQGTLIVFRAQDELDPAQRSALEHLAVLVGVSAARLRGAARLARQQTALMALWEIAGVLRSALDLQEALDEACGRMTSALDLDWLALLAPDERQSTVTLLIARGSLAKPAPRLTGTQLRVAAEALHSECALIRSEGRQALTCLPIRLLGDTPVVLAAHGEALDAAAQALLMLLGEMIVERLARPTVDERRPAPDVRRTTVGVRGMQGAAALRESSLV